MEKGLEDDDGKLLIFGKYFHQKIGENIANLNTTQVRMYYNF
jgi:hypothetical protein